jgi:hypothetical protein
MARAPVDDALAASKEALSTRPFAQQDVEDVKQRALAIPVGTCRSFYVTTKPHTVPQSCGRLTAASGRI